MPCTRTAKVKDALASFAAGTLESVSKQEMKSSSKASIRYDMVIEPKKKRRNKESERSEDKYVAFATNTPWTDMEEYGRRWGIETGYRMVENARAKTSSVKKPARIFCFLYSLMLFNAWILANAALAAFLKTARGCHSDIATACKNHHSDGNFQECNFYRTAAGSGSQVSTSGLTEKARGPGHAHSVPFHHHVQHYPVPHLRILLNLANLEHLLVFHGLSGLF